MFLPVWGLKFGLAEEGCSLFNCLIWSWMLDESGDSASAFSACFWFWTPEMIGSWLPASSPDGLPFDLSSLSFNPATLFVYFGSSFEGWSCSLDLEGCFTFYFSFFLVRISSFFSFFVVSASLSLADFFAGVSSSFRFGVLPFLSGFVWSASLDLDG